VMHARLSLWQDLKILSRKKREGGRQKELYLITSGKKSAEAHTKVIHTIWFLVTDFIGETKATELQANGGFRFQVSGFSYKSRCFQLQLLKDLRKEVVSLKSVNKVQFYFKVCHRRRIKPGCPGHPVSTVGHHDGQGSLSSLCYGVFNFPSKFFPLSFSCGKERKNKEGIFE